MSNFRTTTGQFFQNVEIVFLVYHYYDITTSKMSFELITTTTSQRRKCLFSSSLLRKSECRKELKEHRKSHFCLIFTF